ncbi:DUF998 domain-containing protein [Gordonia sp. CPCC 205515]|uniref:DUF998 domain-containing protein n=1 Tax=Gordonia sp. CPCC 205515 TaxID=3140791 RepID=UPI003AF346D9
MTGVNSWAIRGTTAAVLIAVAGICYSSWVLEFFWSTPLDPLRSFLSELDAAHRPHRGVYVAGDITTAITSLAAGLLLLLPRPLFGGWKAITAVVALAAFGASTLADALLPIECIPGIDPGCPVEPSGLLPQLHHVHALTSTLAVFSIFTAMIAATVTSYRDRIWPLLRTAGLVVLVIVVVSTVWMLAADNAHGDFRLGLAQRIQVGGMTVWLVLWGVAIALAVRQTTQRRSTMSAPAVDS